MDNEISIAKVEAWIARCMRLLLRCDAWLCSFAVVQRTGLNVRRLLFGKNYTPSRQLEIRQDLLAQI